MDSTDAKAHETAQKRIALIAKKRQAEQRFRQQITKTYGNLDDQSDCEKEKIPLYNQTDEHDADIHISRQQDRNALRAEIIQFECQTDRVQLLKKEMEVLRTNNQLPQQRVLKSSISTVVCSCLEQSTSDEQHQIDVCPSDSSAQRKGIRPRKRFPRLSCASFSLNKSPGRTNSERATSLNRNRWSLSCILPRGKSNRGLDRLLSSDDVSTLKAKYDSLQRKCHELTEHNDRLQERNEVTRHEVAQLNQQVFVLQQSIGKLFDAAKHFEDKSELKLTSKMTEKQTSPYTVVDWVPIHCTSDHYNDDAWTMFQQSNGEFSELSAFPIVSLAFSSTQRIAI